MLSLIRYIFQLTDAHKIYYSILNTHVAEMYPDMVLTALIFNVNSASSSERAADEAVLNIIQELECFHYSL
jgi:hypothetical protein